MGTFPHDRKLKVIADLEAKEAERKALAEQAASGLPAPTHHQATPCAPHVPINPESLTGR